jgi:hypothetical protein
MLRGLAGCALGAVLRPIFSYRGQYPLSPRYKRAPAPPRSTTVPRECRSRYKVSNPPPSSESHRSVSPTFIIGPAAGKASATGLLDYDRAGVDSAIVGSPSLARPLHMAPAFTWPYTPWLIGSTPVESVRAEPFMGQPSPEGWPTRCQKLWPLISPLLTRCMHSYEYHFPCPSTPSQSESNLSLRVGTVRFHRIMWQRLVSSIIVAQFQCVTLLVFPLTSLADLRVTHANHRPSDPRKPDHHR